MQFYYIVLNILTHSLFSQDVFIYRALGEKLYLREDTASIVVSFKSSEYIGDSVDVISIVQNIDDKTQYEMFTPQMMKIQTCISYDSIVGLFSEYSNKLNISKIYYPVSDNHIHWSSNRVVVMLSNEELLLTLLSEMSIEYEDITVFNENNKYGIYVLTLSGMVDRSIQVANLLYETGMVISAQPDFYFTIDLNNYNDQWGMHNTGQYGIDYTGIDIKAPEAWDITQGSNIKVAVIDEGVDLTHPDLYNNLHQWGYDATDGAYGGLNGGCILDNLNGHGTCCAGIIAAENNNIGVTGIASSSEIISIRAIYNNPNGNAISNDLWVAKAVRKAWNYYNADVLSFSIGKHSISNVVDVAIDSALTLGRNGKGCIIAASSGNYDPINNPSTSIIYPALKNEVIAVGAISPCGERKSYQSCDAETSWGSCYGTELSVVAPGVLIPTTDIQDVNGYNPTKPLHILCGAYGGATEYSNTDYTIWFNGTSAAAPHVSGVAALMLSVNSNLTSAQVKMIIEQTAQRIRDVNEDPENGLYSYTESSDHPNGPWNDQMGYGLIDAHAAVMEAYFYDRQILGSNTISPCNITYPCNGIFTYNLNSSTVPSNTTVQWSVSGNLALVSSNNQSISVQPTGNGTGTITITYTHEGYPVTRHKEVTIENMPPSSNYYCNYSTTGNMTLNNELYINGTFTINYGHVVTISGIGFCFPDSKIIVQPGGKLIVDDGKLTSYCPGKMWNGIYVVGNKNQRQLASYQGTLVVKNNSIIENAKCAIRNWDGSNTNTAGGIVNVSSGSTLRNNTIAAEFMPYTNHDSNGALTADNSYFTTSNFLINNSNILSNNGQTFENFVYLSGVYGISFRGCDFADRRTAANAQAKGINAMASQFSVDEYCPSGVYGLYTCQCSLTPTRSNFHRLGRAIKVNNNGSTYTFTVRRTDFDTCYRAVDIYATNSFQVIESDFDLNIYPTFDFGTSAGVNIQNSTGYKVEGNSFYTGY